MTHQQKILGGIAAVFLIVALFISLEPGHMFYRSASTDSSGYDGYAESAAMMAGSAVMMDESFAVKMMSPESSYFPPLDGDTEFGQKIIKNGSVTIAVESIEEATAAIKQIAQKYGGDVTDQTVSQYSVASPRDGSLSMRVKAESFDAAMMDIKAVAQDVTYESISTDDVTSEYVDIEARLKNAYAEEASYVAVLERATTVEDILKVQDYLSQVRAEIESMEAQKKYYDSQTAYSTIYVTMTEDTDVTFSDDSFRPWQAVKDAAQTVIDGFQEFILGLIKFIIVGGAIILPIGLIGLIGRILYRKVRK